MLALHYCLLEWLEVRVIAVGNNLLYWNKRFIAVWIDLIYWILGIIAGLVDF